MRAKCHAILFILILFLLNIISSQTDEDAYEFIARVSSHLDPLYHTKQLATWDYEVNRTLENYYTKQNATLDFLYYLGTALNESRQFNTSQFSDKNLQRQFNLFKTISEYPPPLQEEDTKLLVQLLDEMTSIYRQKKGCPPRMECMGVLELQDAISKNRVYNTLEEIWKSWRSVFSKVLAPLYSDYLEEIEEGAHNAGFDNVWDMWASMFDLSSGNELDTVLSTMWKEIKPLYEQLHCYTRAKLSQHYGLYRFSGLIPAHVLGDLWAENWENIFDLLQPYKFENSFDVSDNLTSQGWDAFRMLNFTELLYEKLNLKKYPDGTKRSFTYERISSEDICQASIFDLVQKFGENSPIIDIRIKTCTKQTHRDLLKLQEIGGMLQYYLAQANQPFLYRRGSKITMLAIAKAFTLSLTPNYFFKAGLLNNGSLTAENTINYLLKQALSNVVYLPFILSVDGWRASLFRDSTIMLRATEKYWELVREYQGVQAPVQRVSTDFDAAANFAVVAGYPLLDQFFATVLQYQIHETLCRQQGHSGPIHECTLSEASIGAALNNIMSLGASISWQDAIFKLTGSTGYNTTALLNYYEPLLKWLQKENENRSCGWHQELGFSALIATASVVVGCFLFISVIVFYFRIVGPRLEKKFN